MSVSVSKSLLVAVSTDGYSSALRDLMESLLVKTVPLRVSWLREVFSRSSEVGTLCKFITDVFAFFETGARDLSFWPFF